MIQGIASVAPRPEGNCGSPFRRGATVSASDVKARAMALGADLAGRSMCPARESASISPRATISRGAPLACRQLHASHSFCESCRRLSPGFAATSSRMKLTR